MFINKNNEVFNLITFINNYNVNFNKLRRLIVKILVKKLEIKKLKVNKFLIYNKYLVNFILDFGVIKYIISDKTLFYSYKISEKTVS